MDELIKRLSRYSKQCVANKLDADFADAVEEAKAELNAFELMCPNLLIRMDNASKRLDNIQVKIDEIMKENRDLRNELCCKCGDYKMRHKGACDGCRWKDGG